MGACFLKSAPLLLALYQQQQQEVAVAEEEAASLSASLRIRQILLAIVGGFAASATVALRQKTEVAFPDRRAENGCHSVSLSVVRHGSK